MKILFVTTEYVTEKAFDGGLANYIHKVAVWLKRYGHEPIVMTLSEEEGEEESSGVRVIRVPLGKWAKRLFSTKSPPFLGKVLARTHLWILFYFLCLSFSLGKAVKRFLAKESVDVIQYTNLGALPLFAPFTIPFVVRGSSFMFDCERANVERTSFSVVQNILRFMEQRALERAPYIFVPSMFLQRTYESFLGRSVEVIRTPYAFAQGDSNPCQEPFLFECHRYLLYFGTIAYYKGCKTIADMLPMLLEKYRDILVVFIGKNYPFRDGTMMGYVLWRAGNHQARIVYKSSLPHTQLFPIIERSLGVLMPSRIDNMPNSCLEAMALGKVVVGTRGSSIDEMITDGETGLLCDIDDVDGLLRQTERLLTMSDAEREAMGRRARESLTRFSPEVVIPQLLGFYQKAIDNWSQRANK